MNEQDEEKAVSQAFKGYGSATIIDLPKPPPPDWIVGPFTSYHCIIEGRVIPQLTAVRCPNGNVVLTVDNRFSSEVPGDKAYEIAWLIVQALAVGAGYSHLGAENKEQPFAAMCSRISLEPK
jgi:hypothetical protein